MILRLTIDAFTATAETSATLRQLQQDRALGKSSIALMTGGIGGAITHYADAGTPQVVIVEDDDPASLLSRLEHLAEVCNAGTRVVVIGGINDIALYRNLIARGVSDYLPRPIEGRQVADALERLFADPHTAPRGRTIACWGARGGVGSSSVAQNLAWELGRQYQEEVVYIDLDLAFGTSVLAYNIDAKQTVADALAHPERLDEVLIERCMVEYDDHLSILASPADCRVRPPMAVEALEQLLELTCRMAAFVVLDLPHQWAEWTEHLLVQADEVVLTAVPDFASLRDTKAVMEAVSGRRGGAVPPRLVLNKVEASRKTQLTAKDFEDTISVKAVASIALEAGVFADAATNGQMVGEAAKNHKVTQVLGQLATVVAGKAPSGRRAKAGPFAQLLSLLKR